MTRKQRQSKRGTLHTRYARKRRWREQLWKQSGGRCTWCRMPLTPTTKTLDHVIPLAEGGSNDRENIVLACEPCNTQRGNQVIGQTQLHRILGRQEDTQ